MLYCAPAIIKAMSPITFIFCPQNKNQLAEITFDKLDEHKVKQDGNQTT
jgi:hypothetical protein